MCVGVDRRLGAAALLALMVACGGGAGPYADGPPGAAEIERGEEVYRTVCSECHSLEPPPRLAPPLSHIARVVRSRVEDRPAFTRHIVSYVQGPSDERSLLPTDAIRRFGLMPAQALPEARLMDAAAYLWSLADSTAPEIEGR